jgi:hypothetical protein
MNTKFNVKDLEAEINEKQLTKEIKSEVEE